MYQEPLKAIGREVGKTTGKRFAGWWAARLQKKKRLPRFARWLEKMSKR